MWSLAIDADGLGGEGRGGLQHRRGWLGPWEGKGPGDGVAEMAETWTSWSSQRGEEGLALGSPWGPASGGIRKAGGRGPVWTGGRAKLPWVFEVVPGIQMLWFVPKQDLTLTCWISRTSPGYFMISLQVKDPCDYIWGRFGQKS